MARFSIHACLIVCSLALSQPAWAQIGEPTGFTITVKHGASTLATKSVTVGPGGDLTDIKISDGTPESFTQIGTVGGSNPMILKVVTDDDATFRVLHMYIDVPLSLLNIDWPGPTSLFAPGGPSLIDVSVSNMTFNNGAIALPQLGNSSSYFTAFMRDMGGHFYELPQANAFNSFGHGVNDIQVPGSAFLDGNASQYTFTSTAGASSSWEWQKIVNPGFGTTIHNGISGGLPSFGSGYVFELGLSVAFTAVPEPSTILFVIGGGVVLFGTGRRAARRIRTPLNEN